MPTLIDFKWLSKTATAEDQQLVERTIREWFAELVFERATLDQQCLLIDGNDKEKAVRIIVYYSADDGTYADLIHVLKIMLPDIDVRPKPNGPD